MPSESLTQQDRFAHRATVWQLRKRTLQLADCPLLMGIVNVTPDSFSDGGQFFTPDAAVAHALQLAAEGADILDVGGESTRPRAEPVSEQEELDRVLPVVERLTKETATPISIDTQKSAVASAAVAAGAEIINDISGLESDAEMVSVAASTGAAVCVMHTQGTPQTMQDHPTYTDVVREVHDYLAARRDALIAAGISAERIALDPGLGFGKTFDHNMALLQNCHTFHDLGCPLLVGPSRKSFLGRLIGDPTADRTAATIGVSLKLAVQGVQIFRVHDVRSIREAMLAFHATSPAVSEIRRVE